VERLVSSPREEVRRLSSELSAGEAETTPLIAVSVIGIAAGLFVAIVIALVLLAIYLA
jgi:tetrahydromethanopterin S-methyltransferase subunit F